MKRLLFLLIVPFVMAAECGTDDPTDPDIEAVIGSWTLVSLNNDPLPAPWTDAGNTFTVTAGSVTINANGNFTFTETMTGRPVDQTTGTWTATATANTYSFIPNVTAGDEANNGTGVVNGNTLTLTISGSNDVRVYNKN